MSKRKRKSRKNVKILSAILVVLIIIAIIIFHLDEKRDSESNATGSGESENSQEQSGITFPYVLEDEGIEIVSIFPYSGTNPDFDDEDCENVGALQVINQSGEHLEKADIDVMLSDGSKLEFQMEEIPGGKEVLAFEINNEEYESTKSVIEIQVDVKRASEKKLNEDVVKYELGEEEISLTNVSDTELADIKVKYHCSLNEMYFGGKCFSGVIETLKPGESAVLDASECYLGEVTVVDITY